MYDGRILKDAEPYVENQGCGVLLMAQDVHTFWILNGELGNMFPQLENKQCSWTTCGESGNWVYVVICTQNAV